MAEGTALSFLIAAIDQASEVFAGVGDSMEDLADDAADQGDRAGEGFSSKFGTALKVGTAAAAAGAGLLVASSFMEALDQEKATDKMAAQLGLSDAESSRLGHLAGEIYADAYGESFDGVTEAMQAVMAGFPDIQAAGSDALQDITQKALTFADAFDGDVSEAVNTASMMIRNGLAASADQAFDLMVYASQKLPPALRGELSPIMDEYGQFFHALGFTGPEAVSLMVKAAQGGQIGMDKYGDALKEFTIRATDMSTSSGAAFETLGLNQQQMADDILAGGDAAFEATSTIRNALIDVKDPAAQAQAALALFGTPLEDLGVDKIPAFLQGLVGMDEGMDDAKGAADKMGDTLRDNASTRIDEFKRSAEQAFVNLLGDHVIPIVSNLTGFLGRFSGVLGPLAVGLGILAGVIYAVNTAQKIWTASQAAFNIVMGLNPVVLITLAIIALIAIIIVAWQHSETFRDIVTGAFDAVLGAVKAVWHWISDNWPLLLTILTGPIGAAVALVVKHWDSIKAGFTAVKDWIGDRVGDIAGFIEALPDKIKAAANGILAALTLPFRTAFSWIAKAWNNSVGRLSFTLPEWTNKATLGLVPKGAGFSMPKVPENIPAPSFERGGIVRVGDNGSGIEAIIPLERAAEMGFGGGGGTVVNVTVQGFVGDEASLVRKFMDALAKAKRDGFQFA